MSADTTEPTPITLTVDALKALQSPFVNRMPGTLYRIDDNAESRLSELDRRALWAWRSKTAARIRETVGDPADVLGVLAIVQAFEGAAWSVDVDTLAQHATPEELENLEPVLGVLASFGAVVATERPQSLAADAKTSTVHTIHTPTLALAWLRERAAWLLAYLPALARVDRREAGTNADH